MQVFNQDKIYPKLDDQYYFLDFNFCELTPFSNDRLPHFQMKLTDIFTLHELLHRSFSIDLTTG